MNIHPRIIKILKAILSALSLILLIYVLLKASLIFMPFLIAFGIASMLEPIVNFFSTKLKIKKKLSIFLTLIMFLSTIGVAIFFIISKLITEITVVSKNLTTLYNQYSEDIGIKFGQLKTFYENIPKDKTDSIESSLSSLSGTLVSFINKFLNGLLGFATVIPQALIITLIVIISIYFILCDKDKIIKFIKDQIPTKWLSESKKLTDNVFTAVIRYLKAQAILIFITFIVLLTSFLIFDIDYALLIAFTTSLVDALPVLGIGSILLPWALFQLLFGSTSLAIVLIVTYVVALLVRQVLEPKILGNQMGVHPLVAIMAMYVGLKYYGIPGLILSPICVMVAKNILEEALKHQKLKELFDKEPPQKNEQ